MLNKKIVAIEGNPEDDLFHITYIGAVFLMIAKSEGTIMDPCLAYTEDGTFIGARRFEHIEKWVAKTPLITLIFSEKLIEEEGFKFNDCLSLGSWYYQVAGLIPLTLLTDRSKEEVFSELTMLLKGSPELKLEEEAIRTSLEYFKDNE
jgi:hypothetical protein